MALPIFVLYIQITSIFDASRLGCFSVLINLVFKISSNESASDFFQTLTLKSIPLRFFFHQSSPLLREIVYTILYIQFHHLQMILITRLLGGFIL